MRIIAKTSAGEKEILTGKDKTDAQRLEAGEMFACPNCGKPLEFGADRCSGCHVFLDAATGQIRSEVSDHELNSELKKGLEDGRKKQYIMFAGIALAIVGLIINGGFGLVLFIAGVMTGVLGFAAVKGAKDKFKTQLSYTVIPDILSEIFDDVVYDAGRTIDSNVVYNTDMGFPSSFDEMGGSDYIKASYRGVGIELSDITLVHVSTHTSTDEDGDTTESETRRTVFQGQWLICDFHKELSADLCVFEGGRKRKGQIKTENVAFNKKYGITCDNEHDAFYVLTPSMMEHIITMDQRAGGDTYLRFLREGKVHLAVNNNRDIFEVKSLKNTDVDAMRKQFREELKYVTDLIDTLLGIDTLYKQ